MVGPAQQDVGDGNSRFAKALANNDVKVRDKALLALTKWLASREEVSELDLLKLWKGMFFAMWHADKAPVQVGPDAACGPPRPQHAAPATLELMFPFPLSPTQADVAERMAQIIGHLREEARIWGNHHTLSRAAVPNQPTPLNSRPWSPQRRRWLSYISTPASPPCGASTLSPQQPRRPPGDPYRMIRRQPSAID